MNQKLIVIILLLALSGCSIEPDANKVVTFPIYEECNTTLSKFIKESSYEQLLMSIHYFDVTSEAHSSIVGYAQITGKEGEDFNIYLNTALGICHPSGLIEITQKESGYRAAFHEYLRISSAENTKEPYIVFSEESIFLYYNERYSSWWKQ